MPLIDNDLLQQASRYIDAIAEESGVPETIRRQGVDPDAALAIAQQRALRIYGLLTGQISGRVDPAAPPPSIRADPNMLAALATMWLDGVAVGRYVDQLAEDS